MISIKVDMIGFGKLAALVSKMGPAGRVQLNRVGANAATAKVQRHIHSYARGKHFSAAAVGGTPTGHYEKGAAAITSSASAASATILIPIPGISRAYHDIDIATPTKKGKKYLTIPKHAASYGHTVPEMKSRGWTIFRPGKKKVLLGYRNKGEKPVVLFALAEAVHQKRDPRLLPTQRELSDVFATSMCREIERVLRKAGRQ